MEGRDTVPRVTGKKHTSMEWMHWLECIEHIPSAAYAVRNDESLTLLGGNSSFYKLFACSMEDMQLKYGGRLGAVLEAEPLKKLPVPELEPIGPISIKQKIKRCGVDGWIQTEMFLCPAEGGTVLCCVSTDITMYEIDISFAQSMRIAAQQANLDYFEYDFEYDRAIARSEFTMLPQELLLEDKTIPDFLEKMISNKIIQPGFEMVFKNAFHAVGGHGEPLSCEIQIQNKERGLLWGKFSIARKPNPKYAVCILEDITQEKEAARNYLTETQFFQTLLSEKDAYAQIDVTENRITRVGGMWNLYNEVIDKVTYSHLIQEFINKVVHPEDRMHYLEVMQQQNFIQSLENGIDRLGCEFRRIVSQNKMTWMQLNVHLFKDPLTRHVLALLTIKNIDVRKKQELMLLHGLRVDQLTNIYNRKVAERIIQEYLAQAQEHELCAFVMLDIDNFKRVNDSYGYDIGDQVLVQISDLMSSIFRRSDIVGRFGADEFILFLKNLDSTKQISDRIEELYSILRNADMACAITCSAGIAISHGNCEYNIMLKQALQALNMAKAAGKDRFAFYSTGDEEAEREHEYREVQLGTEAMPILSKQRVVGNGEIVRSRTESRSFDNFIGEQGDIAYLVDPDSFVLICGNQAFYDRIGMNEAQCAGMTCYEAMHRRDTPCPFCSKANWSTDKFYLWRNLNLALEQEFLIKNKLVSWGGKETLLAIAVDISNDKSIVDSMENGAMETHSILSGVQHMTGAKTLSGAMESALESIGSFFRADAVHFLQYQHSASEYTCTYRWVQKQKNRRITENPRAVDEWLESHSWEQSIMMESPEAMLGYSYEMYQHMKLNGIKNQRWMRIKENDEVLGFLCIENISSNFQNVAFLESFAVFVASELKKRGLVESVLYAERHDDLTNLLSRKSFEKYMLEYRPDQIVCVGVVLANFNNLKGINSSSGFQTGNYFICQFADMLRIVFDTECIFRLNGDEFLVILPEISRTRMEDRISKLEQRVAENGTFTVSIGHSWDDVENDLDILLEQATQAMKVNKKRHYDAEPDYANAERRRMLNDLVASIESKEFEVFLQPKVELECGKVMGAEALIRYHHKDLGYFQPAQFIDILERNNLIRYIDLFVFEEVCRQLEDWKLKGWPLPIISVNFSRLTLLERDILSHMESIADRYRVSKNYVEIEITESIASMGKSILYQAMRDIYEAGFAISLDDFGTKYTNLAILADINFNILKVDKSLVGELSQHGNQQLIMKNIISMCKDLGIDVLAEGIETKEQERILRQLHCHLGQGYLYGKPMPIADFAKLYVLPGAEKRIVTD